MSAAPGPLASPSTWSGAPSSYPSHSAPATSALIRRSLSCRSPRRSACWTRGGEAEEVGELGDAGLGDAPVPGRVGIAGDRTFLDQPLDVVSQGQQPGQVAARNAMGGAGNNYQMQNSLDRRIISSIR